MICGNSTIKDGCSIAQYKNHMLLEYQEIALSINTNTKGIIYVRDREAYTYTPGAVLSGMLNDEYSGLYQTWDEGIREEVSYSMRGIDHGEKIIFNLLGEVMEVTYHLCESDEFMSGDITSEVKPYFADPLNPTKEEQLEVRLAFDIPLIPYNLPELRDANGRTVYED